MFSFRVVASPEDIAKRLNIRARLESRVVAPPEAFTEVQSLLGAVWGVPCVTALWQQAMRLRVESHQKRNYSPAGDVGSLQPGTYYLESVDEMFRRQYARKP